MIYFQNITNLDQAKFQYRTLAKQLHPDKGGSAIEFQQMQKEYKDLLITLKQKDCNLDSNKTLEEIDILNELGKLGKTLLKTQLPQQFLKQKIQNSQNLYEKLVYKEINKLLDGLS